VRSVFKRRKARGTISGVFEDEEKSKWVFPQKVFVFR